MERTWVKKGKENALPFETWFLDFRSGYKSIE